MTTTADFDSEFVKRHLGTNANREHMLIGYRAVKFIIGADGVHPAELEGLLAEMQRVKCSPDMLDEIRDYDISKTTLEQVLPPVPKGGAIAKQFIYGAVTVAHADGVYSEPERRTVRRAAELLGVAPTTLAAIEGLVAQESATAALRLALLAD